MPYRSQAQRKFFHTKNAKKAGITPAEVKEFDESSKGMSLPDAIKKKKDDDTRRKMWQGGYAEGGEIKSDSYTSPERYTMQGPPPIEELNHTADPMDRKRQIEHIDEMQKEKEPTFGEEDHYADGGMVKDKKPNPIGYPSGASMSDGGKAEDEPATQFQKSFHDASEHEKPHSEQPKPEYTPVCSSCGAHSTPIKYADGGKVFRQDLPRQEKKQEHLLADAIKKHRR